MNILFVGDVFGQPGRDALIGWLPGYRFKHNVDFVIANGENAANGAGITSKIALRLLGAGVDIITPATTSGARKMCIHSWQRTVASCARRTTLPGRRAAAWVDPPATAPRLRSSTWPAICSWAPACRPSVWGRPGLVDEAMELAEVIVVDIHAEATSEKVAMGHYLDGRVTAVLGHAHARADVRRARAARRHRLHDRRRHDRAARVGHRGEDRDHRAPLSHRAAGDGSRSPMVPCA